MNWTQRIGQLACKLQTSRNALPGRFQATSRWRSFRPAPLGLALVLSAPMAVGAPQDSPGLEASTSEAAIPTGIESAPMESSAESEAPTPRDLNQRYTEAVEFWRAGEHARAGAIWKALEIDAGPAREPGRDEGPVFSRAALFHALGNAEFRAERPLRAAGYYLRALEHSPRDLGLRRNLALARSAADVDLEDDRSTLERFAGIANPSEARWLALLGLIPLAIGGLVEALCGGLIGRLTAIAGLVASLVLATPYLFDRFGPEGSRLLVTSSESVTARSEPRGDAARVGEVSPGERLTEVERWPGWVRVELSPELRAWVPDSSVFGLDL